MHVVDTVNARQLATAAQEAGAVVRAGPLRRPSETGDWQLGDTDLCHVCAYPLDAASACPRCALRDEVAALRRVIEPALRMREIEERLIRLDDKTY
jgi:hypothetical protein